MKDLLKKIIRKTPIYYPLRNWRFNRSQEKSAVEWETQGKPVPPPHIIKQRTLKSYAKRYGLKLFVETGTFCGDMVEAMRKSFDRIYSIELSTEVCVEAKKRFQRVKHVEVIHGDSGIELGKVMNGITQPALFWLDGHYSGGITVKGNKDTPIYEELGHILNAPDRGHVVIIDDARLFGADPAYPSIEDLTNFIRSRTPDISIDIQDDMIRLTPKQ